VAEKFRKLKFPAGFGKAGKKGNKIPEIKKEKMKFGS